MSVFWSYKGSSAARRVLRSRGLGVPVRVDGSDIFGAMVRYQEAR